VASRAAGPSSNIVGPRASSGDIRRPPAFVVAGNHFLGVPCSRLQTDRGPISFVASAGSPFYAKPLQYNILASHRAPVLFSWLGSNTIDVAGPRASPPNTKGGSPVHGRLQPSRAYPNPAANEARPNRSDGPRLPAAACASLAPVHRHPGPSTISCCTRSMRLSDPDRSPIEEIRRGSGSRSAFN